MPTSFMDGPAAGVGLNLGRAPIFLRVVQVVEQMGGFDALDQLEDEPRDGEIVHVYRKLPGSHGSAHICGRGSGHVGCGYYEWGIYRHMADVDGELLRDTGRWRAWVDEQVKADPALADRGVMPVEA